MAYKLSVRAVDDIIHVYQEGVRLFGVNQAEKYHAGMEKVFQFLSEMLEAARERPEISPPVRIHPYQSHIIVYHIDITEDVLILRVRHGRENWVQNPLGSDRLS